MSGLNNTTGNAIANLDHIKQSVADILTTPLNSRVMRRNYGSAGAELIGHPLNESTLLQLYAACALAIAQWEPRVRITAIKRTLHPSKKGQALLTLEIIRLDTSTEEAATFSLALSI